MIVTARQLEDLHRQNGGNGQVTLPYRARLTPLAADWVRAKKIVLGYGDNGTVTASEPAHVPGTPPLPPAVTQPARDGAFLWWCDGPCGPAKAAVVAHEGESNLRALGKPADANQLIGAIREVSSEIKAGRAIGAVLLVQSGAAATVFANRCPSLRAMVGTSLESVEQGVRQAAANVLIIEHPQKTLQQVRNLLSRFTRAKRELPEELRRQLEELKSCG